MCVLHFDTARRGEQEHTALQLNLFHLCVLLHFIGCRLLWCWALASCQHVAFIWALFVFKCAVDYLTRFVLCIFDGQIHTPIGMGYELASRGKIFILFVLTYVIFQKHQMKAVLWFAFTALANEILCKHSVKASVIPSNMSNTSSNGKCD